MAVTRHTVAEPDGDRRLDRWFSERFPALAHGRLEKLLRTGQIRVNGKRVKAGYRLSPGEVIRVPPLEPATQEAVPPKPRTRKRAGRPAGSAQEDRRFLESIAVYRDASVLIVNKPAGLPVQGGTGQTRHLDVMLRHLAGAKEPPRLVHRLDKDTSGVMAIALTRQAAASLTAAFRSRDVRKLYWAVVVGAPARRRGIVDLALARRGGPGMERAIVAEHPETGILADDARRARTRFAVVDHAANRVSWLALLPLTGRTHQLRAHCQSLDTPILGDGKYGGSDAFVAGLPKRVHLHARRLIAPHPDGGWVDAEAAMPSHMVETFDTMGFDPNADTDPFEFGMPDAARMRKSGTARPPDDLKKLNPVRE